VERSGTLSGIGTLQAAHQVAIASEAGGRVARVFFDSGERVQAGMPLVQLNDSPDRADLMNFQAQAELASREFSRSSALAQRQFAAARTVDQNREQLKRASAGVAKVEAVLTQKRILAPFSGQIGLRQVEVGQYLNPGSEVAVLTNLDRLWINFAVPERHRNRLRVGQEVSFTVDADPGRVFSARITTIDPQVRTDTRTVRVQASLDNTDHRLMPGMFADVTVRLDEAVKMVVVPETAIDYARSGEGVYIVSPGGSAGAGDGTDMLARRVPVKTGERFDGLVVVSEGLAAGALVVAAGQQRLVPGRPIVPRRDDGIGSAPVHLARE
jgi:multidrug efflux system membrane fusion protein